ncbi:MAG: LPS biosynthesis protein, partial [Gemmatimonadales bacterium]|nr:LPS biosynthesis protein [Gemmatimonadales bacterium]
MTEAREPSLVSGNTSVNVRVRACVRCLYDTSIPGVAFDDDGECSYCALHDQMDAQYPTGDAGESILEAMVDEMKAAGRGKDYDCILGVSGGCDSSYLAHEMVRRGLRPLAVHFDNTWNSPIATNNIYTVLDQLEVPLETYVVDNYEYDDIYRAFIESGVRDIEAATDIGFMGVLYRAAEKHGVQHIVEGHSFRTEGVSPLGWLYMDGRYIREVHRRHGTVPMKTFPDMPFGKFVKWAAFSGIRRIRPLYWLDYDKEATKRFLTSEYGWEWYGGHHLENRFTAFYHTYFLPRRFGIDMRVNELSGRVRSGQLTREHAKAEYDLDPLVDPELLAMVKKRLG